MLPGASATIDDPCPISMSPSSSTSSILSAKATTIAAFFDRIITGLGISHAKTEQYEARKSTALMLKGQRNAGTGVDTVESTLERPSNDVKKHLVSMRTSFQVPSVTLRPRGKLWERRTKSRAERNRASGNEPQSMGQAIGAKRKRCANGEKQEVGQRVSKRTKRNGNEQKASHQSLPTKKESVRARKR